MKKRLSYAILLALIVLVMVLPTALLASIPVPGLTPSRSLTAPSVDAALLLASSVTPTPSPIRADASHKAAAEAIERHRSDPSYDYYYELVRISQLDPWAYADVFRVAKADGVPIPSEGSIILLHRIGAEWEAILPEDGRRFYDALGKVPDSLLDPLAKDIVRVFGQAEPKAYTVRPSGYRLPWPYPYKATVTTNYHAHGTGQIDFVIRVDDILAAKAGTIVYINDSHPDSMHGGSDYARYNNVVVVRHADNGHGSS